MKFESIFRFELISDGKEGEPMVKQINTYGDEQSNWPCLFCDEWGWDFWH